VPSADPRPLIVLDDESALPALRVKLHASGWRTQEGFSLPAADWDVTRLRVVCAGRVASPAELEAALLAAVRGAGLIVLTPPEPPDEFLEDLARIGSVDRRGGGAGLDSPEVADLLRSLAAGKPVADAAADALVSLRTAHRRLAGARAALGVKTNRELLTEYGRRFEPLE